MFLFMIYEVGDSFRCRASLTGGRCGRFGPRGLWVWSLSINSLTDNGAWLQNGVGGNRIWLGRRNVAAVPNDDFAMDENDEMGSKVEEAVTEVEEVLHGAQWRRYHLIDGVCAVLESV